MPKVLNVYDKNSHGDNCIYIGRPTKWGNPFVIGKDGDRNTVITKYKEWVYKQTNLIKEIKSELKGKNLVCFCTPRKCHGDILLEIANSE